MTDTSAAPASTEERILAGLCPDGIKTPSLTFRRNPSLVQLPRGLQVEYLLIEECPGFAQLPEGLSARGVVIRKCPSFTHIPATVRASRIVIEDCQGLVSIRHGFRCESLEMPGSHLETLSEDVSYHELDLHDSRRLRSIPSLRLRDGIDLSRCTALEALPERISASTLDLSGCTRLRWPEFCLLEVRELILSDCSQLEELPEWLTVEDFIEFGGTSIRSLPRSLGLCGLRWRGVEIDEQTAFGEVSGEHVLREKNAERRRFLLERLGYEAFLEQVKPAVLDRDLDPGGERRLLQLPVRDVDGEHIQLLSVQCPSTGRRYLLRTPPWVTTCFQAAAWMADLDPSVYVPIKET